MIKKNCLYCEKEFQDKTSNRNKLYCSIPCRRSFLWRKNFSRDSKKQNNYVRKWRKENPELSKKYDISRKDSIQVKARYQVTLMKAKCPELFPQECCICGETKNIEFHHPCYDFALSVYPLCKTHHLEIHSNDLKI